MCMFVLGNEVAARVRIRVIVNSICKMPSWKTRMPHAAGSTAAGRQLRVVDLHAYAGGEAGAAALGAAPAAGERRCAAHARRRAAGRGRGAARLAATAARSEAEIAFQPGRVLMHDTTSTPALVDIAAMRDALAEAGVDPARAEPGAAGGRLGRPFARGRGLRAAGRARRQHAARAAPQRRALPLPALGVEGAARACASIRPAPGSCTPSTWSSSRRW